MWALKEELGVACFNSAPDVSGERRPGSRARRRPVCRTCFNSAPDVSGERPEARATFQVTVTELQFGPRCIWGETARRSDRLTGVGLLQFGPRCIWGETLVRPVTLENQVGASIRPQMYLGRDRVRPHPVPGGRRGFNSAPDVSGERLEDFDPGVRRELLQFGPRCIWGETKPRKPRRKRPRRLQFGPRCIWGETFQ